MNHHAHDFTNVHDHELSWRLFEKADRLFCDGRDGTQVEPVQDCEWQDDATVFVGL
jgi:hypothetical protein